MKKLLLIISSVVMLLAGCGNADDKSKGGAGENAGDASLVETLPITGSFINLAYQDVRNLYTNPPYMDNTDPGMWMAKVAEMKEMGMEYLVFMAVANEGLAFYPSRLMHWAYPTWRMSPVDAIMNAAAANGIKVFMSTGWAKDQDDNLRDPKIKGRQIEMMEELSVIYGKHPAFYGWYLPVEDCLGPVLTDYAVEAVNALTARARELTPNAKILISPYGIFNSDFDDPRYEQQLSRLNVDIIAYQDEVGCVRERYPLPRLRENWKKLRAIHDKTGVEMWANCESFAWEKGTNDRSSALIPAPYSRLLAQQAAATAGGAERIISFMMCGIYEKPDSPYQLGQPHWSGEAYEDYMAWKADDRYWKLAEAAFTGSLKSGNSWMAWNPQDFGQGRSIVIRDGKTAQEDAADKRWAPYQPGVNDIIIDLIQPTQISEVMVRMLNSAKDGISLPVKMYLSASVDGQSWNLMQIKEASGFPNTNHDAFAECVLFDDFRLLKVGENEVKPAALKLTFMCEDKVMIDEIFINPVMAE